MSSVIVFWIASALVVIVTLGVLLRALLRSHPGDNAPADDTASVAIFRDQKRQLDDELGNGAIDATEHARLQKDLAGRLGREVDHPAPREAAPRDKASARARMVVAAVLIVLIPVASGTLYFTLGRPAGLDAAQVSAAKRPVTQEQILAMVETLATRMKSNPGDPKGWALLGRSYAALGRFQESADAYGEAVKRSPGDAPLLADQADALSMAQHTIQGTPTDLIGEALAIDPQNHKALALAAASAAERNEFDKSLDYWHRLASLLPPDSDSAREVADVIADTEKQRADATQSATSQSATSQSATSQSATSQSATSQAGTSQDATSQDATSPPAAAGTGGPQLPNAKSATPQATATGAAISGDVSLAPDLAARARPEQTVFIFARAVDGPRMPLAVLRTTVRELPRAFVLDDSMAMAPGMTISSAKNVVVEARVSQTGNATPGPGDLVGKSATLTPGAANIHVRIDTVNP